MIEVRRMTTGDVDAVVAVVRAANEDAERRAGREPEVPTDEQREAFRKGMERFVGRDPDGAWVAVHRSDGVVGMAQSIRRGAFWGLSMLFVDPHMQSQGVGRRLLDAALTYAAGSRVRMILTSSDPRALRRYALAGLAIHPTVEVAGEIDRRAIPGGIPGRAGDARDLNLVEEVDAALRGSRAEDVQFLLDVGAHMEVVESGAHRGYAVYRPNRLLMLGATDDDTAALLLWRVLAEAGEGFGIWGLTAAQNWAVQVALAARLRVTPAGPLFIDGRPHPPGPWVPSGWYF